MNPYGWSIIYFLATLVTVWLAFQVPWVKHIREASLLLLARLITDNTTYYFMHDKHWTFYAVLDAACAWACLYVGIRHMSGLVLCMAGLFVLSSMQNAEFFTAQDFSNTAIYNFDYHQNLVFIGQLLLLSCAAISGLRKNPRHA